MGVDEAQDPRQYESLQGSEFETRSVEAIYVNIRSFRTGTSMTALASGPIRLEHSARQLYYPLRMIKVSEWAEGASNTLL